MYFSDRKRFYLAKVKCNSDGGSNAVPGLSVPSARGLSVGPSATLKGNAELENKTLCERQNVQLKADFKKKQRSIY